MPSQLNQERVREKNVEEWAISSFMNKKIVEEIKIYGCYHGSGPWHLRRSRHQEAGEIP